jgi:hypothetical protein
MPAPPAITALVERFREQRDAYLAPAYNETQIRREFLDPFFGELGWDIANARGLPDALKDVIHEDRLLIGGTHRAPDYCFRAGGKRQFFVEAKKPSVNLRDSAASAFQLRRYAWSAALPLGILTDFDEFAVYDCRIAPKHSDAAAIARLHYFTYNDYLEQWDVIAELFAHEAVLNGSVEAYRQSNRVRRGTSEVDSAFLAEIEKWRRALTHDIAENNPTISQRELNFAVQQTIDRIVFLRIAEDRGLEPYGQLREAGESNSVYSALGRIFRRADDRYNSGLFHFAIEAGRDSASDELTLGLTISDKPLKKIISRLYYPQSPYEFSVLPTRVLGQVYEQFLGKIIVLSATHKAKLEDKPEVKKAGGVYYTPAPIVDFIVDSTFAPLLAGKSPRQVSGEAEGRRAVPPFRVLDPACGSGSFLLGSYDYLLDWYLAAYAANRPERWAAGSEPRLRQTPSGTWRLTTTERKRILLTHIFGVDVDSQAVEVTKLSLLLKVLEGESQELFEQLQLHRERALPDLAANIKCGNSLVGPDIYAEQRLDLLDEDRRLQINTFLWENEFADAFATAGGFDAVIGNPPYIDSELMSEYMPAERVYCTRHYAAGSGNWDIFCVFIEKALSLCRPGGRQSFIVPNKLGSAEYAQGARELLTRGHRLVQLRDYSAVPVFPVSVYPIVYVAEKGVGSDAEPVQLERMVVAEPGIVRVGTARALDRPRYFRRGEPWAVFGDIDDASPIERLRADFPKLREVAEVLGAATVAEAYEIEGIIEEGDDVSMSDALRMANSGTIDRYSLLWGHREMRYLGSKYLRPIIAAADRARLPRVRAEQARTPKVIIAGMTRRLECATDLAGEFLAGKSTTIVMSEVNLLFLLGILNSSVVDFYYATEYGGNRLQGGYLRVGPPQVRTIPVPDLSSEEGQQQHDTLVEQVTTMIRLQADRLSAQTPQTQDALARQIEALDDQIDATVYSTYALSPEEIVVVERHRARDAS